MSATNKTTNYELPQFAQTDQPTWLGDFNHAMDLIDKNLAQIGANASTALNAANNAVNRVSTAETDIADVEKVANAAKAQAENCINDLKVTDALVSAIQNTVTSQAASIATLQKNAIPVKTSGSVSIGGGTVTWQMYEVPLTHQVTIWLGIEGVTLDKTADSEVYPVFTIPAGKRFDHNIQLFADSDLKTPASLVVYAEASTGVVRIQQGQGINPRVYNTDCVFTYNY